MPTALQNKTAQAIVNIFETSRINGDYGMVTLLDGDSGQLTYGKAQTTLGSGNLYILIAGYCAASQAQFAAALQPYLQRLNNRDRTLNIDGELKSLLRQAGSDPVMKAQQDEFFDTEFWQPTLASIRYIGAASALGSSIVYDGRIHGSWHRVRDRVIDQFGALETIGEQSWFSRYVDTRRSWLANHSSRALHPTVYRMDCYRDLIAAGNWDLTLPITIRGHRITESSLEPASIEPAVDRPVLRRRDPMMRGENVELLQRALAESGIPMIVDGIFGDATKAAVIRFQMEKGLTADAVVGEQTWAALGL